MGPPKLAQVPRGSWSTLRALGTGNRSPVTAGQNRGPLDPVTNRLGQLVDIAGSLTQARNIQDSWSTPGALGPDRE